jgi:DNA-binding FadR family transcriptional regulator
VRRGGPRAYEHLAVHLRTEIVTGRIRPGQRLPSEAALCDQFGVSRATVREALRVLSSQNLIRTSKGAGGGSFATVPSVDHVSESLGESLNLLASSDYVTLEELIEAREMLAVPAARLAARRRDPDRIAMLRAAIPDDPLALVGDDKFERNKNFHAVLAVVAGNTLLTIAMQPVFTVMQAQLRTAPLDEARHRKINCDHRAIVAAIEAGDEDAVADEMRTHLAFLRPIYERVWSPPQTD